MFYKDLAQDAKELQLQKESAQEQQQKWHQLVELKAKSSSILAKDLDEQLREMTSLTAKLRQTQSDIDAATEKLEECRIDSVTRLNTNSSFKFFETRSTRMSALCCRSQG